MNSELISDNFFAWKKDAKTPEKRIAFFDGGMW